jgi:protein-S-isoprenylcysteine O-methyltransferase Ste14
MHQVSWGAVIAALWIAWLVYWLAASRNVKATRWRESGASQMVSRVLFALAVLCSAWPQRMPPVLRARLFPPSPVLSALGAIVWRVHVEERELRGIFPHYDEYRRETAALVPFVF